MSVRFADLAIVGARVWSGGAPRRDVDALAIADDRVIAASREADVRALIGPATRVLEARGATVTPGLCDAHLHFEPWARGIAQPDLTGAPSRAAALAIVSRALGAADDGAPLLGRGWEAERWSEPPDRAALDALAPRRPVLLHSKDFHALWVNSAALLAAGVGRTIPDPPGGRIERDATGEPTGIVRETAVRLFQPLEAAAGPAPELPLLERAASALHALGITAVHDFERRASTLRRMQTLAGRRALRVLQQIGPEQLEGVIAAGLASGAGDSFFRLGALKLFADGTLGSRTAALLEPYAGTDERGMDVMTKGELDTLVERATSAGVSVSIHAIGDRAVRHALDAIEGSRARLAALALPPRIEHAQLVHPLDLPRFAALGVVASMQPQHCVTDAAQATRDWGARCSTAYPWRALLASGAALVFGSDAPVEPPSASLGLASAVTRRRPDGYPPGGFVPEQRVTLDEALSAYIEAPARLAGTWPRLGRLAAGAEADVVVWDRDLHACEPMELPAARVRATVLAGELVYEAGAGGSSSPESGGAGSAPLREDG